MSRDLWASMPILLSGLLSSCYIAEPCGDNYYYDEPTHSCLLTPPLDAGTSSADAAADDGAADADTNTASAEDVPFGTPCSSDADCGGITAVCVQEPIPLGCTNIDCASGETNAGICPNDWMCFPASSTDPSACVKF